MTALRALIRKEAAVLFGSPVAYLTLAMVGIVTALVFFDHLRVYNQTLFVWSSSTMGGFETDTIPDYINLRVLVFLPVMEQLALMLIGLVPLVTMRVFAEERARGTDELLITTQLSSGRIVAGKFIVAYALVALMLAVSFVYPATSIVTAGLGLRHLAAVYTGLLGAGTGDRLHRAGVLRLHLQPARRRGIGLRHRLRAVRLHLGDPVPGRAAGAGEASWTSSPCTRASAASPRVSWPCRTWSTSRVWAR